MEDIWRLAFDLGHVQGWLTDSERKKIGKIIAAATVRKEADRQARLALARKIKQERAAANLPWPFNIQYDYEPLTVAEREWRRKYPPTTVLNFPCSPPITKQLRAEDVVA
jgi:hypothetical protein